jgi:phosphoribosylaminoimidazole-succinocarboxamide synthase
LSDLLITPSTKGVLKGIPGVPEVDDVNITRTDIEANYLQFNFNRRDDIATYEQLLSDGFALIERELRQHDQLFVDTKFEFGYVTNHEGHEQLIYMDEVGTPDSSRIWDGPNYRNGKVLENSKEVFRQLLLEHFSDPDILLDKQRMPERLALAEDNALPRAMMEKVSETYLQLAEKITGQPLYLSDNPRAEIIDVLSSKYALIATDV